MASPFLAEPKNRLNFPSVLGRSVRVLFSLPEVHDPTIMPTTEKHYATFVREETDGAYTISTISTDAMETTANHHSRLAAASTCLRLVLCCHQPNLWRRWKHGCNCTERFRR